MSATVHFPLEYLDEQLLLLLQPATNVHLRNITQLPAGIIAESETHLKLEVIVRALSGWLNTSIHVIVYTLYIIRTCTLCIHVTKDNLYAYIYQIRELERLSDRYAYRLCQPLTRYSV